jgi:hypothetical protein
MSSCARVIQLDADPIIIIAGGDYCPGPFPIIQLALLPLTMWHVVEVIDRAQHRIWLCADEVGAIDGLIDGHPESIPLEVVYDIRRAHWFVFGLGGRALCLRGLCTCALLLVFLGGAAFFGPMARLATVVALALVSPSLPIFGCCGG